MASQIGLLVGAGFWGFSADVIGRKLAFNRSLFSCAALVIVDGGMPSYIHFFCVSVRVASPRRVSKDNCDSSVATLPCRCRGGLHYRCHQLLGVPANQPSIDEWLVALMAVWWAVGYMITGFLAWGFMSTYSFTPKATPATCSISDNMGWRYLHFTCGALVLVLSLARLAFVKMVQAPRWQIAQNLDEEIIQTLNNISITAQRPYSPTLETLQAGGVVLHTEKSVWSSLRLKMHFKGLFQTRTLAWSTTFIPSNRFVIGMVSPIFSVFLPFYLKSRGNSLEAALQLRNLERLRHPNKQY